MAATRRRAVGLGRGDRRQLFVPEPALTDPRLLAPALAQVVELGPPNVSSRDDLELADRGRMQRERPLDPDPERDLPHGKGLLEPAALAADHHTLEHLDALAT